MLFIAWAVPQMCALWFTQQPNKTEMNKEKNGPEKALIKKCIKNQIQCSIILGGGERMVY